MGNGGQQVGGMMSGVGSTSTNTNVANNLKSKRANLSSHLHKTSSAISYQKATVHYVSNTLKNFWCTRFTLSPSC
jgi:hypothetical protein